MDTLEIRFTRTITETQVVTVPLHDEGEGRVCWDEDYAMSQIDADNWATTSIELDDGEPE